MENWSVYWLKLSELNKTSSPTIAHLRAIINLWAFFRFSGAANSIVSGPIWLKLKLLDIILDSYKFKMDRINSNREKVIF